MKCHFEPHHGTPSRLPKAWVKATVSVSVTRPDHGSDPAAYPSVVPAECGWKWALEILERAPTLRAGAAISRAPIGTRDQTSPRSPQLAAGGCTSLPVCGSFSFQVLELARCVQIEGDRATVFLPLWRALATPATPGNLPWTVSLLWPSAGHRSHSSPMRKQTTRQLHHNPIILSLVIP